MQCYLISHPITEMRWWKSDKKRDPPNPRKLTRAPKLRHLSDVEIGNLKFKKEEELKRTSVSSFNGEIVSPLPLPIPREDEAGLRMSFSSLGMVSPRDEIHGPRGSDARSSSASSSIFYPSRMLVIQLYISAIYFCFSTLILFILF